MQNGNMTKKSYNTMEMNDNFKSTANLTSNPGFQSSLSITSKLDQEIYNPFEHRNVEHPNTVLGSIVHLLKVFLGTGMLAMPVAFKYSGLLVGSIGMVFAGIICTHTVHILVKTGQEACVVAKKPSLSYSEICGAVVSYGPKKVQPWGPVVKTIVDYALPLGYVSILCVYVVFIVSSLKEVIGVYTPGVELSIQTYCAILLIPLILLCQIRNLKYLVPFSLIANVGIFVVFVITFYYIFTDLPPISERENVASVETWPLFFCTVVFAMEGIGVVMPIENEMARPQKFLGCPGVLNTSMIFVVILYGIFGFFGYVQYGDAVKGSITLNLPQDDLIAQSTKLLMALVIFFSYSIQFYVPMELINRKLKERKPVRYYNLIQISIRTFIVCFSVGVAAAFPNLGLIISFFGAIFSSTFGLLVPALAETLFRWDRDLGCMNYILWKNILIGFIAILTLVSGSYASIVGIIEEFYGVSEQIVRNSTVT